jgi:peptidyl-prolyl cis-trans isomerase SurA
MINRFKKHGVKNVVMAGKIHKANLLQDYSKIQKASIESKKNEYINTWIDEKIGTTFIRLEQKYATCPNLDIWINQSRGAN